MSIETSLAYQQAKPAHMDVCVFFVMRDASLSILVGELGNFLGGVRLAFSLFGRGSFVCVLCHGDGERLV